MSQENQIMNYDVGASFGSGDELFTDAEALRSAHKISAVFDNSSADSFPKGRGLKDNTDGGTDGLKTEWTNGVIGTQTGLCILMHDVVLDGSGGQVIATAVDASLGIKASVCTDSAGAALDANFTAAVPFIKFA